LEAAPTGGEVVVRTYRPGRGRVELTVEDTGPGISPDARKNLFVPYFTTKPGGTGIGLALVRQIVLGHGGVVSAEDRPGGGTVMRVALPAQSGTLDSRVGTAEGRERDPQPHHPGGGRQPGGPRGAALPVQAGGLARGRAQRAGARGADRGARGRGPRPAR